MQIDVKPSNIRTLAVRINKNGKYSHARLTIPLDLVDAYDLRDKDMIVIAYICRAGENTAV